MLQLLSTSYEFADVLRRLITEFRVVPVQALDTPQVRPRGMLTLNWGCLLDGAPTGQPLTPVTANIELFQPPEHIHWINACGSLHVGRPRMSLKQIAVQLGIGHMTAKRALDYARLMRDAGLLQHT